MKIFISTILFITTLAITSCQEKAHKNNGLQEPNSKVTGSLETVDQQGLSKTKVIMKTIHGNIVFAFYSKDASITSNRIFTLIKEGFYDGLKFHRVLPGFIVQTGSPDGSAYGGSGVTIKKEKNQLTHEKGSIALVTRDSDADSGDSQFYIAIDDFAKLDGKYTIFAKVTDGLEILDQISKDDIIISMDILN